ncbi:hypothetical protein AK830_g10224 [Neonectria ditissima]|uniref:Uncharacterized protein n=1 Tax=Neonectria ditissima TaxID=78410 RepID=A0A0P7B457_9HYPO|nr:hypothetical protein AK830_g10224 [Neonectria ditissima]
MKDLLPLSLPKSRPRTPSPLRTEEAMSGESNQCFPEFLARDLEMSSAVFAAKNMTAGIPSTVLASEEKSKQRTMSCPGRILTSPYQTASLRIRTLGSIDERDSVVSFMEQRGCGAEGSSDLDSLPGTESSGGLEGPSISLHQQSIATAATSLTSASGSAPSPKSLLSRQPLSREHSWIDADSEDDMDKEEDESGSNEQTPLALSPRPPTLGSTDPVFDNMGSIKELARSRTPLNQTSSSTNGTPSRRHSVRSVEIPPRRASLTFTATSLEAPSRSQSPLTCPDSMLSPYKRLQTFQLSKPTSNAPAFRHRNDFDLDPLDFDEDSIFDADLRPWPRASTVYIQPTPPPSPLPTVQAWLDGSNPPFVPQPPVDDLNKAVPLPPDVMETLRVSIACFPETMLLSSSLTIETIRAFSKKVRHPSNDPRRESLGDFVPHVPRKSLWKKVVWHGRGSISTRLHRSHQSHDDDDAEVMANLEVSVAPNPWAPLRHVFGSCSDYICDALYAHMVAYNYVSRVPRSQSTSSTRSSTSSSKKSQKEDIPKKAASLLGLDGLHAPPSVGRIAKKLSAPLTAWGFGKDEMSPVGGASTAAQDNTTRNIEAGLLRCVMRLIGTARMMAEEGGGEERMMEMEPQEADMMFVRSLCEIVRISEEAAL